MTDEQGFRMLNPPHPGSFLKIELTEGRNLTVTDAAEALHVTRAALSAVLNGKASLTSEMALRFEKAFGFSMETLMRMQHGYDIAQARQHAGEIDVPPYVPKAKPEPQPSLL
jgi:addiction module HigA family antidote